MKVKKRNGDYEEVSFDKVTNRIKFLCNMLPKLSSIDPIVIAQKVNSEIYEVTMPVLLRPVRGLDFQQSCWHWKRNPGGGGKLQHRRHIDDPARHGCW